MREKYNIRQNIDKLELIRDVLEIMRNSRINSIKIESLDKNRKNKINYKINFEISIICIIYVIIRIICLIFVIMAKNLTRMYYRKGTQVEGGDKFERADPYGLN